MSIHSGGTAKIASLQIWGKGYRVTADSEEFQRYIPHQLPQAPSLEAAASGLSWGRVLELLYPLTERELAGQRCLLVDPTGLIAFSFSHSEDKHRRPSLVVTAAFVAINWEEDDGLGDIAAKAVALAQRLSLAYAGVFKGNPENVSVQLRQGAFLPSRFFELMEEEADRSVDWHSVFSAVKQWRGVVGVATTKLLPLGANIVLGTRFEAERALQQFAVDGYFDVREKEIHPLSSGITKWKSPSSREPVSLQQLSPTVTSVSDLRPVVEALQSINRSLDRLVDVATQIVDVFRDKRKK
ncbi:hypothetical protein [Myxococcus eversor]|uniref:hypothetical protein n=1 Tax=Myxococcus eversor TaxID=2709661 RepID=UPI0013D82435|nr:hypothetical protein [Myxococcus eversor]